MLQTHTPPPAPRRTRKARALALVAPLVVALVALGSTQLACAKRAPRNLVLITLDTLRSDRLGSYGYPKATSPTLDALARRGALFRDAIAQATTTPPSHASILTGQNPPTHGLRKLYGQQLPDANTTLAEILAAAGYTTAAFVSAVPLRGDTGLSQGFTVYDDSWEIESEDDRHERNAAETNERVIEWLDTTPDTPLFLWVHYFDPHFPYFPPEDYQRRFGVDKAVREFLPAPRDMSLRKQQNRQKPIDPAVVEKMSALYDAEIAYLDAAIGSLLEQLEHRGLLQDTAIAIVADHGEMLGEYGYFFGHWGITDETSRVPMLLVHPDGRFAGAQVSHAVGTIDLVPTLLSWLDIDANLHFDGRDLTPMLEGEAPEPRALYTEQFEYFPVRAVRNEEWILEQRAPRNTRIATGPRVLYRRRANGFPRHPAPSDPELIEELGAQLDAVLHPPVKHPTEKLTVPDDVREQLRALGYEAK
jgi:arylsulfatase A-like enzyme